MRNAISRGILPRLIGVAPGECDHFAILCERETRHQPPHGVQSESCDTKANHETLTVFRFVVQKSHSTFAGEESSVDAPLCTSVLPVVMAFGDSRERNHRGHGVSRRRHELRRFGTQPFFSSASSAGSILPPLITATLIRVSGNSSRWKRNAATATAPLGSATVFGLALSKRVASRISSSVT